jgi:hypothetical protein
MLWKNIITHKQENNIMSYNVEMIDYLEEMLDSTNINDVLDALIGLCRRKSEWGKPQESTKWLEIAKIIAKANNLAIGL